MHIHHTMEQELRLLIELLQLREKKVIYQKKQYYHLIMQEYFAYKLVRPKSPPDEWVWTMMRLSVRVWYPTFVHSYTFMYRSIYDQTPEDHHEFELDVFWRIQQLERTFFGEQTPSMTVSRRHFQQKVELYNEWSEILVVKIEEMRRKVRLQRKRPGKDWCVQHQDEGTMVSDHILTVHAIGLFLSDSMMKYAFCRINTIGDFTE